MSTLCQSVCLDSVKAVKVLKRTSAAISSYVTVPSPYNHVYSAGGPTGEVHVIDQVTGGLTEKIQQLLFVPEDELQSADKTRVALVQKLPIFWILS